MIKHSRSLIRGNVQHYVPCKNIPVELTTFRVFSRSKRQERQKSEKGLVHGSSIPVNPDIINQSNHQKFETRRLEVRSSSHRIKSDLLFHLNSLESEKSTGLVTLDES